MRGIILLIIILVILLILLGGILFTLKQLGIVEGYPYIIHLQNIGDKESLVTVYVNGRKYETVNLKVGDDPKKGLKIGPNIQNPLTGEGFKQDEIASISFYMHEDGRVRYSSPNINQPLSFSTDQEDVPPSPIRDTVSLSPIQDTILTKQGSYTLSF